jgi:pentatricopeptide repeat protein
VCVGKFRQAEALLESLKAAAGAAGRPMVSAYNLILKGHVAADNLDAARRAFGAMSARGLSPDAVTFNTLISGFVRRGDVGQARALLRSMRAEGVQPDVWTYTTLALGYGRAGQLAEMRGVVQEMQQAGVAANSVSILYWAWVGLAWLG